MNPLNLIARVLAPKREPAGYQPANLGSRYPEAERIAASLRDFPGDWGWRMKGYELEHSPTGFVMWVANEDYGLAEVSSGHKSKFKPDEQKIIWPAVQAWLAAHKVGFTGRLNTSAGPGPPTRRRAGWKITADGCSSVHWINRGIVLFLGLLLAFEERSEGLANTFEHGLFLTCHCRW